MEKSKAFLVVCDGIGDLQVNGKTPLQKASKPNMDKLAEMGQNGLVHTIGVGVIPGSDTAHLALFGYDPYKYYKGRGTFEALGSGMTLEHGDVAFRCNFATVDPKFKVIDRRAGRIGTDIARELGKSLDGMEIDGVKIVFKPTTEHRATLVLRGKGLSCKVGDTDPHGCESVLEAKPLDGSKEAKKTADVLNKFTKKSYELLKEHAINKNRAEKGENQANIALARGAGEFEAVDSLEKRFGFKSACIAGGALYKGVARFVGMDILDVKGATGTVDTNVLAKAKAAREALKKYDFVFVHVKGMDGASHDGNYDAKVKMVEKIDKLIGELLKENAYIILTGDHTTPIVKKEHSHEPVPICIYGKNVRIDDVKTFDEFAAAKGSLGQIRGIEVMQIIASLMGFTHIFGA
ncbi:MAG: 2,3-bisphosphoglycerate-independent phosphoglycerate mutase [Candidatus Micrarchaeota archaeon]